MWAIICFVLLGTVAPLHNLFETARQAHADGVPVVLYVSRSDCSFCPAFEKEVLQPVIKSGEYDDVVFVELIMDSPDLVVDLAGARVTPAQLAADLDVFVTPTIVFMNGEGRETVRRLLGYRRNDYAMFYFEQAIRQARRMREPRSLGSGL